MRKEDIKRIEEEEAQRADERAIDRENGRLDTTNTHRVFRNLIDKGVWINPREESYKTAREREQSRLKNNTSQNE